MKINVVTLCSGYDSQMLALRRLQENFPYFEPELVAWAEIDDSAIKAHNILFPEYADRNMGDITTADWSKLGGGTQRVDLLTYSTPCFVKDTLVNTQRGVIPIQDVVFGDYVLTHTNSYQRVLQVGSKPNAPIMRVRAMCSANIDCTPEHPFYVRKRYRYGHASKRAFEPATWINAEDLTKDHFLGYAINRKSELPVWEGVIATKHKINRNVIADKLENPAFWYLMGRYLGDGWKRESKNGNSVIICCSDRNRESLVSAVEKCGWHYRLDEERTVTKLHIHSNELYAFIERYGYYAHGKKVDAETMNLPVNLLRSFIEGYVDSDGCYDTRSRLYKITTVSKELAYGIQQCISKVYHCHVSMSFFKRPQTTVIEGRTVNQRDTWTLAWHTDTRKQDVAFYEDGYVWFPITEILQNQYTDTVYNLEVETDNSYTANGTIVHNCQDISNAGKQKGLTENSDTRSSIIWDVKRAIETLKPKYLLLENVKALVSKKFMPDFTAWCKTLEDLGYTNFWQVLNAKDYGVAQNRERVFMVSILDPDKTAKYNFPQPMPLTKCVEDYMLPAEEIDESYFIAQNYVTTKVLKDILDQPNVRAEMEKLYNEQTGSDKPSE